MANVLVDDAYLTDAANAIREKTGESLTYFPAEFGAGIRRISGGGDAPPFDDLVARTISGDVITHAPKIGAYAFQDCSAMISLAADMATTIEANGLQGCRGLLSVSAPEVVSIGDYGMQNCVNLASISFPELIYVNAHSIRNCLLLENAHMPKVVSIARYAMFDCKKIESLDFSALESIGDFAFGSSGLSKLIIRTSSVCSLSNVNALNGTPISDAAGYVYVPSSFLSEYQNDTNWSVYAEQIRAIEYYPEITGDAT